MAGDDLAQERRGTGPLVWVHAPPPAERPAAAELIRGLAAERKGLSFLVTETGTAPDWTAGIARLPAHACDAIPREAFRPGAGILDRWRPDVAVFYPETLPMGLAAQAEARGTALVLVARELPEPWRHRWRIGSGLTRRLLRRFDRVFVQDNAAIEHLRAMGLTRGQIDACGPLSEGSAALGCSEAERAALAGLLGTRPAWLATDTRKSEDAIVVAAHSQAMRQSHRLLLFLSPDDPARGPALARRLRDEGWDVALRSDEEEPGPETQIYVTDTEGELGLWLRLAPITFHGGTLGDPGGTDPFHAASHGSVVLHGPGTGEFADRYARLDAARAAVLVRNEKTLADAVADMLSPDRAAARANAAWEVSTEGAEATARVVDRIARALDRTGVR